MLQPNLRAIPSLKVWLDAHRPQSFSIDSAQRVASATDISLAGNNLTESTDSRKFLYEPGVINGLPALRGYNSTTASMLSVADNTTLDYTTCAMFVVAQRHTSLAAVESFVAKNVATGNQREFRFRTTTNDRLVLGISPDGNATETSATGSMVLATGVPYILEGYIGEGVVSVGVNGNLDRASTAFAGPPFNGTSSLFMGSRQYAEPCASHFGEVLFFTDCLNLNLRRRVVNYLSRKWKIPVVI
jgi:hypothetical protein